MKHIQEYRLFESDENRDKELLKKINKDEVSAPWLFKADMTEEEMGIYYEDVSIKTPYGKKITVRFSSPDWEYTGDGDWNATIYAYDDYGIKYSCTGHIRSYGYPEDDQSAEWDGVYAEIYDPVSFCDKIFDTEPLIVARIYSLLPDDKKQAVSLKLTDRGLNQDLLKGANVLNRLNDI